MSREVDEFARPKPTRRKKKRYLGRKLALGAFLVMLLLVALLPQLLTASLVERAANQYGGLSPLKVELQRLRAGWLAPVSVGGIRLSDADGNLLVKVDSVATEKSLLSWITDSSDLGRIRVSGIESFVVITDGTSNIEQALEPLLSQYADADDETDEDDPNATSNMSGSIEIIDSKALLTEQGRPEQWVVEIPSASIELPSAGRVVGPVEAQVRFGDVSGTVANSAGTLSANVKQSDTETFDISLQMAGLPLEIWHLAKARLPELPVDQLTGRVSAALTGRIVDAERWDFQIDQFESHNIAAVAPTLLGDKPARLTVIDAAGRATLDGKRLEIQGAQLRCDFANTLASASLAWPIEEITLSDPFLPNSKIDARGTIDLAKLAVAAESLLPVREQTKLLSGAAQFAFTQSIDRQTAIPSINATVDLTNLKAIASGQSISWDEPLSADFGLTRGEAGAQFSSNVSAEFCKLRGGGTLESGQLAGELDLAKLHNRLNQWVELPISQMEGASSLRLTWSMTDTDTLQANGTMSTSPLTLATSTGTALREPAWKGQLAVNARIKEASLEALESAHFEMTASNEMVKFDLLAPLDLTGESDKPAGFVINLATDLDKTNQRSLAWLAEPPEVALSGTLNLAVEGLVDTAHVEILTANWRSKPIRVSTPQLNFAEPEMIGSFRGRVDSSDLTRLVVDDLRVQATSFSLMAKDAADSQTAGGRLGQADFLVDLGRLLNNTANGPADTAARSGTESAATSYAAAGQVNGQLAWRVTTDAAGIALQTDGSNLVISSRSETGQAAELWREPSVKLGLKGNWTAATGEVNLQQMQAQTDWMAYTGSAIFHTGASSPTTGSEQNRPSSVTTAAEAQAAQSLELDGQLVYDCNQLSSKLSPFTGNQVHLAGRQTVPVKATWTSPADPNKSMLSGLFATTRLGWEQAEVGGVKVGVADVPLNVEAGLLTTATEIPVNGGVLRWDLVSDLTADNLVIRQKPMQVLENVEISQEMCNTWLKYVAPLVADAASINGRLSVRLDRAEFTPAELTKQTVAGQLAVHDAAVGPSPFSSSIIQLVKQIDAIRKKEVAQTVSSQKTWMRMSQQQVDFEMVDGRIRHNNMAVTVGDATISTSGSVGLAGDMDLQANMPIPDDWAAKSQWLAGLSGQSLTFPVKGTFSQPRMDTSLLKQFGTQAVQSAADGLIQQGISKGFEKLFGKGGLPGFPGAGDQ